MSTTITIHILKEDKNEVVPEETLNEIVSSYAESMIHVDSGDFIPLRYCCRYGDENDRNNTLREKYPVTRVFGGYVKKDTRTVCYCISSEDFISSMYELARDICRENGYYTLNEVVPEYVDDLPVSIEYVLNGPWDRRFEHLLMDGHVTFDIVKHYGGIDFQERFSKKKSEEYDPEDDTWNLKRLRDICQMCKTLKKSDEYTENDGRFEYHVAVEIS